MSETESSSLRDIVTVLFKYWRSILAIFLLSAVFGLISVLLATPQYTASSKLLVQVGREKTASFAVERQHDVGVALMERAQDINDEVEIIRDPALMLRLLPLVKEKLAQSRPPHAGGLIGGLRHWIADLGGDAGDLLHGALRSLGLASAPVPADQKLVMTLMDHLLIDFTKDTDVVVVNFTWADPDFAAYVVNQLVRVYQEEHLRVHGTENSVAFYQDQLADTRRELTGAEQALADFLRTGQISNIDAEKSLALDYLSQLDKDLNLARLSLENARQKLASIEESYRKSSGWIETLDPDMTEASIKALDESFVALSGERTKLLVHFSSDYPAVASIEAQLAQLREQKYAALKSYYAARATESQEKIASLEAKIAAKKDELGRLGDRTLEHDRLVHQRDQLQADVNNMKQKVDDLQIRDDLDAHNFSSVKVISEATPPAIPSAPRKVLITTASALAGLFFGIIFAILSEFFNHTFRHERDVRRVLGIPLLSTVPYLER